MTTGKPRSRTACSSRLRLMPCGRTRSVGSGEPPGTSIVSPNSPCLGTERQLGVVGLVEGVRVDRPGPLLRLVATASPARPGRATPSAARARVPRARGVSSVVAAAPRSSGPRSAISPATNGVVARTRGEPLAGHHVRRCRSRSGRAASTRAPVRLGSGASRRTPPAGSRAGSRGPLGLAVAAAR